MPVLKLCCCCCRLQTGGVVLGYIESFISLLLLIVGIVIVAKSDSVIDTLNNIINATAESLPPEDKDKLQLIDSKSFKIEMIIFVVFIAICLLVSITLVIGATKRNHKLIVPYLGVKLLYFVYSVIQFIIILVNDTNKVMTSLQFLVYLGLSIYLWLCVFSLFQELREHQNSPRDAYVMQQQPYNPQVYKPPSIPN